MDHADEPIHDPADVGLYFRSRMPAALGLCMQLYEFSEGDLAEITERSTFTKSFAARSNARRVRCSARRRPSRTDRGGTYFRQRRGECDQPFCSRFSPTPALARRFGQSDCGPTSTIA